MNVSIVLLDLMQLMLLCVFTFCSLLHVGTHNTFYGEYILRLNIKEVGECKASETKIIFVNDITKLISQQVRVSHVHI